MNQQDIIAATLARLNGHDLNALTPQMQQLIENDKALEQQIKFIEQLWQENLAEQPSRELDARFYQMLNQAQTVQYQMSQAKVESKGSAASDHKPKLNWWHNTPAHLYQLIQKWFMPKPLMQFALMAGVFTVGYQWDHGTDPLATNPVADQNQLIVAQLQQQVNSLHSLVALSMINSQSASKRLAGIKYSTESGGPDPQLNHALIQLLRNDSSSSIRLSALDALARNEYTVELETQLMNSFEQQSLMVQIKLIDFLLSHDSGNVQSQFNPGTEVYHQLLPEAKEFLQDLSNQQI